MDPNFFSNIGLTPEIVEEILKAKAGNPSQFASYWEADENDITEATQDEIENDPTQRVLWAAENGHVEILKELLVANPELNSVTDSDGYSCLHRASYNGHLACIDLLITKGADVNARTLDGWCPLHSAARWSESQAVSLLISHGACVNNQTNGGQTALHLAAAEPSNPETLTMLLKQHDCDVTLRNKVDETARTVCERTSPFGNLWTLRESGALWEEAEKMDTKEANTSSNEGDLEETDQCVASASSATTEGTNTIADSSLNVKVNDDKCS